MEFHRRPDPEERRQLTMTPSDLTKMVFWGATGQARVLRECMQHNGVPLVALFDNDAHVESPFGDVPLYRGRAGFEAWYRSESNAASVGFLIAIGGDRGRDRVELHETLEAKGLRPLIARHPSAFIADSAFLGAGTQVLAHACVCADVRLGRSVIVNTAASVDHESVLGDGVHLCPGARLAGSVIVEDFAMIGTGAVIGPRVRIGVGSVVGAGAVVLRDVHARQVVVGNPARVLRTKE
jgi:sugar O-acyltransferase (sialic acid O-acetyltransferase NeuD family)